MGHDQCHDSSGKIFLRGSNWQRKPNTSSRRGATTPCTISPWTAHDGPRAAPRYRVLRGPTARPVPPSATIQPRPGPLGPGLSRSTPADEIRMRDGGGCEEGREHDRAPRMGNANSKPQPGTTDCSVNFVGFTKPPTQRQGFSARIESAVLICAASKLVRPQLSGRGRSSPQPGVPL